MDLFDKAKKFTHRQSKEVAAFCGGVALLLLVAGFVAAGGTARIGQSVAANNVSPSSLTANIFDCFFSSCGGGDVQHIYTLSANTYTVTPGAPVTLGWQAYSQIGNGADACINGFAPCSILTTPWTSQQCIDIPANPDAIPPIDTFTGNCTGNIPTPAGDASGTYVVNPTVTTTYYFCSDGMFGLGLTTCPHVTITVVCPAGYTGTPPNCTLPPPPPATPTTFNYFTATPASVTSGNATTLNYSFTPGSGFFGCELVGGNWPTGIYWLPAVGSYGTGALTTNNTIQVNCYDNNAYGWGLWHPLTVGINAAPLAAVSANATINTPVTVGQSATVSFYADSTDAPDQCQINNFDDSIDLKQVASCPSSSNQTYATQVFTVPGTYGYKFYYHRAGVWTFVKEVTVTVNPATAPVCANGLNYATYGPSCTCSAGTSQQPAGSSVCTTDVTPPPSCANGLNYATYGPACTCSLGQVQSGPNCVTPPPVTCSNGLNSSYAPGCDCTVLGQEQDGSICVFAGSIDSLTATPSRVLKGNPATIAWSSSHMATCSLSGFSAAGTDNLSSALSSSIAPAIQSKTIFTLSCIDAAGTPTSESVTVSLIPQTIEQ
jgi:hypothetical protein